MWKIGSIVVGIGVMLAGCWISPTSQRYVDIVEKMTRRHIKTISRNDVTASVAFRPSEYYAAQDMVLDSALSVDSAKARYATSLYIVLGISSAKAGSSSYLLTHKGSAGFSEQVMINDFGREKDIFILHGRDTVLMQNYSYERNWER
jgi:hypothetical protein